MTKVAELPGGKLLKFADNVSEKDMRRAVRRELGLANDDLIEAFEKATVALHESSQEQNDRSKEIAQTITDALARSDKNVAELTKAVTDIGRDHASLSVAMRVAVSKQTDLIIKLQVSIDALNKTLDTALGQSLDALDKSGESFQSTAKLFADGVNAITKASSGLSLMMTDMQKTAAMRKRAVRARDGTWTLEPERVS